MTNYRRAKIPGGLYFFTVVTFDRRKFLTTDFHRYKNTKHYSTERDCKDVDFPGKVSFGE